MNLNMCAANKMWSELNTKCVYLAAELFKQLRVFVVCASHFQPYLSMCTNASIGVHTIRGKRQRKSKSNSYTSQVFENALFLADALMTFDCLQLAVVVGAATAAVESKMMNNVLINLLKKKQYIIHAKQRETKHKKFFLFIW